ncbi:class I SAM-dependent methyltransferase [Salipaludibacillus daqingensis]|uniref:class I SAM-dependent methyltransferase n=1 Tax=Salipaludibacillus daqingensis TaxID=3041001 RepID=UPI002475FF84|nr:class I SAM-dependent methyltransferase [Salipaludibacillus daqingensis]
MSDHYYSEKPSAKSDQKTIKETIIDHTFTFKVDHGVFSKGGLDFGSKLLIETFQEPEVDGKIADVGCGWGPIGIAVAKSFPKRHVRMVDINERSILLSKENASLNHVTDNTFISQNDVMEGFEEGEYAAVITNPPIRAGKEVVFKIYEQSIKALKRGGSIWVVIQKKQGAASTEKKLEELGLEVTTKNKQKGYFIFQGKKID